ncbi:hypothetical protein AVEN_59201-1 [Araneus ventricosus]|uniref:Uncharacterized protein n=1 Tax=Araneus ventricosus TaxID=182803 RepID=A0A4Y2WPB3_ARAVE|nr:hypothetical protein AVEN_59201-1 [Araneus ventricosus]
METKVVNDVLSGEQFKTPAAKRSKEADKGLARKTVDHVQSIKDRGKYKKKRNLQERIIFTLYINGIPKQFNTLLSMHANDTAIIPRNKTPKYIQSALNRHLKTLEDWFIN